MIHKDRGFVIYVDCQPSDAEKEEFLKSDEIKKEAIRIFIASLEHMINYYHTSMIGKHFSST